MSQTVKILGEQIGQRQPPVFEVAALEVAVRDGVVRLRIQTLAAICFEFTLPPASALELAGALESEYLHAEGTHR